MKISGFIGALTCALSLSGAASASIVTVAFDVTASNFTAFFSQAVPPYDPVTGSFSVTFDNAAGIVNSSAITGAFSIPFSGDLLFNYELATDRLVIGANGDAGTIGGGGDDLSLVLTQASTAPFAQGFSYTADARANAIFVASNVVLSRAATGAIPEPGALALWGLGFAGLTLAKRRGRANRPDRIRTTG